MEEAERALALEETHLDAEDDRDRNGDEALSATALRATLDLTACAYDAVAGRRTSSNLN